MTSESTGPCVLVTHKIQPGSDQQFLDALQALHDARRERGWVTDRWLVLKVRDEENTYIQLVEYVSQEAEDAANGPDLAELRRGIGAVSAGRPDHAWTTVVRATV